MLLQGFTTETIKTTGAEIVVAHGGKGPGLLLIHGNPFTHVAWHKVAPRLAQRFTVVLPDLRGYGDSSKPPGGDDHMAYSFRAMAQDQIDVMAKLGFDHFSVAGHDRGARVVHRLCLDHPQAIERAAVIDIVPQHYLFNNVTLAWARHAWHWFFMIQPSPLPERLMGADAEWYIRNKLASASGGREFFDPEAMDEYVRCIKKPGTIYGMCEDYRACASVDLAMDTEDFNAGKRLDLPLLVLWGETGAVGRNHEVAEIWAKYATNIVNAQAISDAGHYLLEENSDESYAVLDAFF